MKQHGIARKNGFVHAESLVHRCFVSPDIRFVNNIVMNQCKVMVSLDGASRIQCFRDVFTESFAGRQQQHGANAFGLHFHYLQRRFVQHFRETFVTFGKKIIFKNGF